MKSRLLTIVFTIINLFANIEQVVCQEETDNKTFGLSASVQGGQLDIILPIWVGSKIVIAPAFSVVYVEDAAIDLGVGIAPRFYLRTGRVAP